MLSFIRAHPCDQWFILYSDILKNGFDDEPFKCLALALRFFQGSQLLFEALPPLQIQSF